MDPEHRRGARQSESNAVELDVTRPEEPNFRDAVLTGCGANLCVEKARAFSRSGERPEGPACPSGLRRARKFDCPDAIGLR